MTGNMVSRINILYLITELDIGGAEKMFYEAATRVDRQKYNPSCACLTGRGAIGEKLSSAGLDVEYLGMCCKSDFRIFPRLIRLMKKRNVHILHTYLFHANILGRIAGRIAGVPIIVSSIQVSEKAKHYHLWLDKLTSPLVDMEVCACEAVRQFTLKEAKIAPTKLTAIPNSIDIGKVDRQWDREGKRAEFGIHNSTRVVGTVSRLSKQKGLEFFVRSASRILKDIPDSVFMVVGDGELKSELKQLAGELGIQHKLIFTGFRQDVAEIMNIFDVFVLSSLWEGMPVALLEAMALSKPVVATSVGGCTELIRNGENGFLVSPSNDTELSNAITRILSSPGLSETMGRNSRKKAGQFSIDKMVEKTEGLYDKIRSTHAF